MNRAGRIPRTLVGLALVLVHIPETPAQDLTGEDGYRAARLRMVDQELAREGITSKPVLEAMRQVPRHRFVPREQWAYAYEDRALPIGHKVTISPPFIVATMTQALNPQPTDRVLEIGTGSGYQAAVLAKLVKEVSTIEIISPLAKEAEQRLDELGYQNVRVKFGDGYKGWPEHAPFDKIIVTCSPESIPQPLADQLREGGKMLIPLGERFQQVFYLIEKRGGELHRTRIAPTVFVPMTGLAEKLRKKQVDPEKPQIVNGGFEQSTDDQPDGWFWKRPPTLMGRDAPEGKTYLMLTNNEPGRGAHVLQALGVDGTKFGRLKFTLRIQGDGLKAGVQPHEVPSLAVGFADGDLLPVGERFLGPWLGTFGWKNVSGTMDVPKEARVAILRIGLNGGIGRLGVDDVRLTAIPR